MSRLALALTLLAAFVTFCVVQDRVTAAGTSRYVERQRAAAARGERVSIDEVMGPAIRQSVRRGLAAAGLVSVAGLAAAAAIGRRRRA